MLWFGECNWSRQCGKVAGDDAVFVVAITDDPNIEVIVVLLCRSGSGVVGGCLFVFVGWAAAVNCYPTGVSLKWWWFVVSVEAVA